MEILGSLPPACDWAGLGMPGSLEEYFRWLDQRGARSVFWIPEPALLPHIGPMLKRHRMSLGVVLPNMSLYSRDVVDRGPVGAVLKRWKGLSLFQKFQLGARMAPHTLGLLKRQFSSGIMLLLEMEFLKLSGFQVENVLLHNSVVDIALALDCRDVFSHFRGWASDHGFTPTFLTYNFGLFTAKLKEWGEDSCRTATPLNPKGYLMSPSRPAVEEMCRRWGSRILAVEVDAAGAVDLESALKYVSNLNVSSLVLPWSSFRQPSMPERFQMWKERIKQMEGLAQGLPSAAVDA